MDTNPMPDLNNPYIITNKEQLSHMRFDGIFQTTY